MNQNNNYNPYNNGINNNPLLDNKTPLSNINQNQEANIQQTNNINTYSNEQISNTPSIDNQIYSNNINQNQEVNIQQINNQINDTNNYSNAQILNNNVQTQYNMNQSNYNPHNQTNQMYINQTATQPYNIENVNAELQPNLNYDNQTQNNNSINDEELLKSFIGKNYEKLTTKKINFSGIFFTFGYMFYRKMFLYGFIIFIINTILVNVFNPFVTSILFSVIIGLFVNKIYLFYAKTKINKIKLVNNQKSIDEIKGICSSKGGTSVGMAVLTTIVLIVVTIIIVYIVGGLSFIKLFFNANKKLNVNNNSEILESTQNNIYNGVIIYDSSANISNEFVISVPDIFEDKSKTYEYNYEYESGNGVFDSCAVSLSIPKGYTSSDSLINQMADYYVNSNTSSVETIKINNINWSLFSYNNSFGDTYYYATTKNNKVYLLKYEINKDASSDCDNYREQILNSIKSK